MKIAVNTRLLLKNKLEGIGWFTYETLRRMVREHPEDEFYFIFDRPYASEYIFADNVIPIVAGPPARHPILFLIWFELSLPRILKKIKPDVFFSPDGYLSLSTNIPSVPVMHDLNFEHFPKDLPWMVRWYYRSMFPRFAKKARRIVTVSQYSADDIVNQYNVSTEKTDVAYNGANTSFTPSSQEEKQKTLKKLSSGKPYLLFVGALHPRKNVVNILKAFEQYKIQNPEDKLKLVIVGEAMWWDKNMDQAFHKMKYKGDIIFAGRMSPEELRLTYGAAESLLYISYFEGFGIPIVEAFKCHTPVITSNITSMPEIAGDAALQTDPFNIEKISQAIYRIRHEKGLKNELTRKGTERAKYFTWDQTAKAIRETLVKVYQNHSL